MTRFLAVLLVCTILIVTQESLAQTANQWRAWFLRSRSDSHFVWRRRSQMPTPRSDFVLTKKDEYSDVAFLTGGCGSQRNEELPRNPDGNFSGIFVCSLSSSVLEYNAEKDTYKELEPFSTPRHRHGAAFMDDKLFIFGGRTDADALINEMEILDYKTNECKCLSGLRMHH